VGHKHGAMNRQNGTVRLGIAGAGIAALQIVGNLSELAGKIVITAVADIRRDNAEYFAAAVKREVEIFDDVGAMCASGAVDAIWIATPNVLHAEHAIVAAEHHVHMICEKPMAVTLEQCQAMVEAVERNGVKYVQGHSKVYDAPIQAMAAVVRSGELGRATSIQTWNYNDWMIRAVMPWEVDTDKHGTGVIFRQGPHQTDIVRYIGGGKVRSVRAIAGRYEPHFPDCESTYTALLDFENGTAATMVFDGNGYWDVCELTWETGEAGLVAKNTGSIQPRKRSTGPVSADEKFALVRGGNPYGYGEGGGWRADSPPRNPFYGLTVVSCEHGVIRQSLDGLYVYDRNGRREIKVPPNKGRTAELTDLYEAVVHDRATMLDVRWGMATSEVCMAILQSSRERREIMLQYQTDVRVPASVG
jgi:phthalate 4,5-cis-dihydrodiol dehydrogenase